MNISKLVSKAIVKSAQSAGLTFNQTQLIDEGKVTSGYIDEIINYLFCETNLIVFRDCFEIDSYNIGQGVTINIRYTSDNYDRNTLCKSAIKELGKAIKGVQSKNSYYGVESVLTSTGGVQKVKVNFRDDTYAYIKSLSMFIIVSAQRITTGECLVDIDFSFTFGFK